MLLLLLLSQLQGVSWLARSWCDGNSVILADEMGLGKTIQSVVFLSYLFHVQRVYGPFLIVVPLSTIMAWSRELHKWAPEMNTIVFVGNKASREAICEHELYTDRGRVKFNVLLTTYEKVTSSLEELSAIKWAALLVDEAHRLKNHESRLHLSLSELKHAFRLLITGTPLQVCRPSPPSAQHNAKTAAGSSKRTQEKKETQHANKTALSRVVVLVVGAL